MKRNALPQVRMPYRGEELDVFDRRKNVKFAAKSRKRRANRLPILLFLLLLAVVIVGVFYLRDALDEPHRYHTQLLLAPADSLIPAPLDFEPRYEIVHTVKSGETLTTIFSQYGLLQEDAQAVYRALTALEGQSSTATIKNNQQLALRLNSQGVLEEVTTAIDPTRQILVSRATGTEFAATIAEVPRKSQERVVNGNIQSSFAVAAYAAGLPYSAIDELVDLFGDRISFHRDFRKNDEFSLVYRDTVLDDGTSLGVGTILAAALEVGGEIFCAVRYVGADGKARYFDQAGKLLGASFLRYPVKFSRISSSFSKSRFHPVLKRNRPHNGVDFAAPTGTPVRSVADGRVEFAGRKGGNGNMVKIIHSKRYSTAYVHLHNIAKGIRTGSKVQRGQVIGSVGMTGLATGPHLHYALYDNGKYVDPLKAKLPVIEDLTRDQRVDPIYLRRVLFTLEHYRGRKIEIAEVEPIR